MSGALRRLRRQIDRLAAGLAVQSDYTRYQHDPAAYAREVLGVRWWYKQVEIARALLEPPYRVLVPSGHDVGKTHTGAALVNWWYDCFNPSVVLTTAPKLEQVKDLLWKEIRAQRKGRPGFTGPRSLRLQDGPKHFAKGMTASQSAGFQGQHEARVLVVLDEAEGVAGEYWDAAATMAAGPGNAVVALYNPTTSGSRAALEERAVDREGRPTWRIIRMSALEHPNIAAELQGLPPPIPSAVRLAKVDQWVQDWCTPIDGAPKPTDIEWRPGSGVWWRPGPRFEARVLGRRPTQAVDAVWSEWAWERAATTTLPLTGPLQIGCDVARYGDDDTAMHVRVGGVSVHHESHNGLSVVQVATRLKLLATEWGRRRGLEPRQVPLVIDDVGVGGGVTDILRADGWHAVAVNVACEAPDPTEYPNLRSALWFGLADEAAKGNVSFAALPPAVRQALRLELLSPLYRLDVRGRRCVEPKDDTKERLKRSPDNADAVMLAYLAVRTVPDRVAGRVAVP